MLEQDQPRRQQEGPQISLADSAKGTIDIDILAMTTNSAIPIDAFTRKPMDGKCWLNVDRCMGHVQVVCFWLAPQERADPRRA